MMRPCPPQKAGDITYIIESKLVSYLQQKQIEENPNQLKHIFDQDTKGKKNRR